MNFLDFSWLLELGERSPFEIMWLFFVKGGWVILLISVIRLAWILRLYRLQGKYLSKIEYVLLAIDVPKNSEQTPRAMEQVFATLTGAHQETSKRDKYTKGEVQLAFSCELVSIDGFVQFLIRTPKVYRDLVEGSVYAFYPDAEITEVEDYTKDMPTNFPDEKYKIWGSELHLVKNEAFPLRTYRYFEDALSQGLKDPLASLLETMSRIQVGEQVWIQIIILPIESSEWVKKVLKEAYKIAGKKTESSSGNSFLTPFFNAFDNFLKWFPIFQTGEVISQKQKKDDPFRLLNLTPGERASVEAIEIKASKLGYRCKIRFIYASPHEKYQTGRVVNSVFGAIKQFGDLTSNALKPNKRTKTSVVWFFRERRANARRTRIMRNYKYRSWYLGRQWFILNVEELATIFHFPAIQIKTPYLKRTDMKKSGSPAELPMVEETQEEEGTPAIHDQLKKLELDNEYYENKYGIKKVLPKTTVGQPSNTTPNETSTIPSNLPIIE